MHSRVRFPLTFDFVRVGILPLAGLLIGVAGCAEPQHDSFATIRGSDAIGEADPGSFEYHYPATAPVLNAGELKRFVKEHPNQVVVLEFWASWSADSRKQISHLAKLHDEHRSDGLRVIACTFDEPREWRTHTVPVLDAAGANYPCVVIPRGARQAIGDWLDPSWGFDLPARFVVDRKGTVLARARSDETILAALDSWGSTRTRRRSIDRQRSVEPGTREIRVASKSRDRGTRTARDRDAKPRPRAQTAAAPRKERETFSSRRDVTTSPRRSRSADTTSSRYASADKRPTTSTQRSESRFDRSARVNTSVRSRPAKRSTIVRRAGTNATSVGPASTRVKLVNITTGRTEWLPVVARDEGLGAVADAVASAVRSRVGRSTNPRIAVMPLSSMRNRNYATPLGREAANEIVKSLKKEGYYDLVSPRRTARAVRDAGATATQIDFDASVIQGKIEADYLLMGWVRNDVDELIRARQATRVAGDAGASDEGYISPRREAEDFSEY